MLLQTRGYTMYPRDLLAQCRRDPELFAPLNRGLGEVEELARARFAG